MNDDGSRRADAATLANQWQRLTEALERLVQLYDAWSKPDESAKWRQELSETKLVEKPTMKR